MDKSKYKNNGMNKKTYKMLFENEIFDIVPKEEWNTEENAKIRNELNNFTYDDFEKRLKKCEKSLSKFVYNDYDNTYSYILPSGDRIKFRVLSECIFNADSHDFIDMLESKKRLKHCHINSTEICANIPQSKVATGFAYVNNLKYLHSVVIYGKTGKERVIDSNMNIDMKLEDYVNLTKFRIVEEVSRDDHIEDMNYLSGLDLGSIGLKEYLTFRNEIINELHRNFDENGNVVLKNDNDFLAKDGTENLEK